MMRYVALACDYDGTLTADGKVSPKVLHGLEEVIASGRKLILVTGRQLEDLLSNFSRVDLFEWIVVENGAVLYRPQTKEERILTEPPPAKFIDELRKRKVEPLSIGRAIISTWKPHENSVLETIRDLGLEFHVIFNRDAVMVLPLGVNKATGLKAAAEHLGLSLHNVVAIGDAENDHAFMSSCECSVAVSNALPMVKERADFVTQRNHGEGVVELIEMLLHDDLHKLESKLKGHHILLGTSEIGKEVTLPPHGVNVLLAGKSGGGKTTIAMGILERLIEQDYQVCILDPEGDYEDVQGTIGLGDNQQSPTPDEVLQLLEKPGSNVIANLIGTPWDDRPAFFLTLLPRLQEMRARTGRPHWLLVDEAHHMLPHSWKPADLALPRETQGLIFITVHPKEVAPAALSFVNIVIAVGQSPSRTYNEFLESLGKKLLPGDNLTLQPGQAMFWSPLEKNHPPVRISMVQSRAKKQRHHRKYAEGEMSPESSFYFRGPEGKLNLRAQNLILFLQMADGVDDATWIYHLRRGDYSRWFSGSIKDKVLATEAERVEKLPDADPSKTRALIRQAIEEHYTLPAKTSKLVPGHGAPAERNLVQKQD